MLRPDEYELSRRFETMPSSPAARVAQDHVGRALDLFAQHERAVTLGALQKSGKPLSALHQRLFAKVLAVDGQQVEGVEHCSPGLPTALRERLLQAREM